MNIGSTTGTPPVRPQVIATGLTHHAAQDLLDWLENHGVIGCVVTCVNGRFQVEIPLTKCSRSKGTDG